MIVDTSVWIDHFRMRNDALVAALDAQQVEMHPFVVGELALGTIPRRRQALRWLDALPLVAVAADSEVRSLVERRRLAGRGIGWVDAHLLASALISHSDLWTEDRRLGEVAAEIGVLGLLAQR